MKHYARVCRPRFEVVLIEVEANDCDSAERLALAQAEGTDAAGWRLLPFDKSAYRAHVERCVSAKDIVHAVWDGEKPGICPSRCTVARA